MKLLSLQLRYVMFLSLTFSIQSVAPFAMRPSTAINTEDQHDYRNIKEYCRASKNRSSQFNYDVTLVGFVNFADGIGRHPILFKHCLGDSVRMNFLSTRNVPAAVEDAQLGLPRLNPNNTGDVGAVAILTDILADKELSLYKKVPNSLIKVAYTMFESTQIPYNWAAILNKKFDMAVVPDQFLVDVYRNCGVQIPIFVLPLPLMLHDFLEMKPRSKPHKPFVFGLTGGFWKRKNQMKVLKAFAREFGNNKNVMLKIHGRFGEEKLLQKLAQKIQEYQLTNVKLLIKPFTHQEYVEFFNSLDCYVFLSRGEGFSITPREALACGKPCILTDNTAQTTICNSGLVRVVPSNKLVPAFYDSHSNYGNEYIKSMAAICNFDTFYESLTEEEFDLVWRAAQIGYQFDCTIHDARVAMRDVYEHYDAYFALAKQGKKWAKQYLPENLHKNYLNLVRPETVILGDKNVIGKKTLITDSKELFDKYCYLLSN